MKRLNRKFRGKNKTTDVLSFPAEPGPGPAVLGDVVVSVPAARRQAALAGWSLEKESLFLVIHGILHLLGHDHEKGPAQAQKMAALHGKLFAKGYPR